MISFEGRHIGKRFAGVVALKDANFRFAGNKICGLVGANGSGKTTFARICAGLIQKDAGELQVGGRPVQINSPQDARGFRIVLAHQNLSLIPDLTVWQNICLGHERRFWRLFLDDRRARDSAAALLEDLVPGEIDLDSKVASLSPAQKQMVEIAKALSQNPELLILDEPTAALKYNHVEQLFRKILDLKKNGVSIIFVSHRLWEITRLCDLVFVFRNGETVGQVDFQQQPRDENLIVPLVTGENIGSIDVDKKALRDFCDVPQSLRLSGVCVGSKLKEVSLAVKRGEVVGIGGLQGQGQEELVMLIAGAARARSGKLLLEDREIHLRHPRHALRKGIYLVPGDRIRDGLFVDHSIFDNLIFPRIPLRQTGLFLKFPRLFDIAERIIAKIGLVPPRRRMPVKNLSGGNQQKVVFGRWLQFSPKVLLLNDPAKGIDILAKGQLYKLVHELAQAGTSVILYASSNEELISNCDRVLIMFEGRIVEEISYEAICDEKLVTSSLRVGGAS
jgi:ribose transport system ATP-binding protein